MVRKFRIHWLLGLILGSFVACVSGSIRHVELTNELPSDLPKELKDRFEVKEEGSFLLTPNVRSRAVPMSLASHHSLKTKKKDKKKKPIAKEREVAAAIPLDASDLPFDYPKRRPEKEAIWIGEKLVYTISYFAMSVGDFTFEVLPFKVLDNRKVYHVRGNVVSSSVFSLFYRLNDFVESFIDYDGIFSHRFHLVLDETKQTRDSLELNDSKKKQTYFWNRWTHKVNGYKEVKEYGAIQPFSQDSVSSLYYLRNLRLEPGQVVTFPVVSEGKTFEAVCTVLKREEIDSPLGKVQALVIRPEMKVDGVIKKPHGDSFLWLTDDDRRFPVRLEAKVRIGTVVASLKKVEFGGASVNAAPSPVPSIVPELK